jgi:cytochrome c-type biogenesis protein CcmH
MKNKLRLFGLMIVFFAINIPTSVFAEDPIPTPSANEVNAIAKNMFCPVCESIPLDVCGTTACIQWREQIKEKLMLGWDESQIYDHFVSLYGDRVLAQPPKKGINWLIYILPPLVIFSAIVIFFRTGKNWQTTSTSFDEELSIDKESSSETSSFQEQIEKDMKNYE